MRMYKPSALALLFGWIFTSLLIGSPDCLFAQDNSKGKLQGLPSSNIYFISQDSSGFLWMGSDKGLSRFDGHTLRHFTMGDDLTDNDIFSMFRDRQGRYWFLTNGGTPTILDHGLFLNAKNTNWLSGIHPGKPGLHITQSNDGAIWYTTYDTIYRIEQDHSVKRIPNPYSGKKNFGFQAVIEYGDSIYLFTNRNVIKEQSGITYDLGADSLKVINYYTKILQAPGGFFYITNNRLLHFSFISKTARLIARLPPDEVILGFLDRYHNDSIFFSSNKNVYRFHLSQSAPEPVSGQLPSHVSSILTDRYGNRWIASMKEGVFYQLSCSNSINAKPLLTSLGKCNSIRKMSAGIYFGFDDGHWALLNNGRISTFSLRGNPYHLPVKKIWEDEKGGHFIITYGDLYYKRDEKENVLTQSVKDVITTPSGTYFATSSGLFKLPVAVDVLSNPVFQFLPAEWVDKSRIYHLEKGNGDSLFAGTPEGLKLFVKDKKVALPWTDPILRSYITSVKKLSNGIIAFSSANEGVGLIDHNRLIVFNRNNGLASNACNTITEGNRLDLWVGSNEGISRLLLPGPHYKVASVPAFYEMKGKTINDLYLSGDSLLVATDNGCYFYRLSQLHPCNVHPEIAFNSFSVNDQEQRIVSSYNLHSDQNNIRISYAGISFNAWGDLYYRYKLRKEDSTWVYTTSTEVRYPFLPDGTYEFQVQSSLDQENWSLPRMIHFVIKRPFWKQWWFILSGLLLVIIILILIFRSIITAQKRKMQVNQLQLQVKLEQASFQKQLAQLQQTALAMQLNPHFIFNALNSIKGLYAGGNTAEARQFISAFASLMRTMLQIGRQNFHTLAEELSFIEQYLDFYSKKTSIPFQYSIHLSADVDTYSIYVPVLLFQPLIENAILHGIEPSSDEGNIQIAILQSGNLLQVDISDNGVGLHYKSKYVTEQKTSRGLSLVKERIELISEGQEGTGVFIAEITNERGLVQGTHAKLVIPIINKELYDTMHHSG